MASMKAAEIHCARSWPIAKYRVISGTATFTMVIDKAEAIMPTITVARTIHLYDSPWRLRRSSSVSG